MHEQLLGSSHLKHLGKEQDSISCVILHALVPYII